VKDIKVKRTIKQIMINKKTIKKRQSMVTNKKGRINKMTIEQEATATSKKRQAIKNDQERRRNIKTIKSMTINDGRIKHDT